MLLQAQKERIDLRNYIVDRYVRAPASEDSVVTMNNIRIPPDRAALYAFRFTRDCRFRVPRNWQLFINPSGPDVIQSRVSKACRMGRRRAVNGSELGASPRSGLSLNRVNLSMRCGIPLPGNARQ
jgi:hypothetical protein